MFDVDILQTRLLQQMLDWLAVFGHPDADQQIRHVALAGLWQCCGMMLRTMNMNHNEASQ